MHTLSINLAKRLSAIALALFLSLSARAVACDVHVHGYTRRDGTYVAPYTRHAPGESSSPGSAGFARDGHGGIRRSEPALYGFKRLHPCPSTGHAYGSCPGYVIDHIIPLKRGGPDAPANMQWLTIEAGKEKDKRE